MSDSRKGCEGCQQDDTLFPFSMAFQPVLDVQERRIDAYEALVRGQAGEGAAHVLAQVTDSNRYAFDQACRVKAVTLAAALNITCGLHINFLPNAVYEPKNCLRSTLAAAAAQNFPLDQLTFEIIEHEAVVDSAHLMRIVREYHRHGFKIALDDFGLGYSGLARLIQLEPDIIKIDRALIQDCGSDQTRLIILKNLVRLGADLDTKIIAEGVETAEEFFALRDAGVRFMQGYVLARPLYERAVGVGEITWPD